MAAIRIRCGLGVRPYPPSPGSSRASEDPGAAALMPPEAARTTKGAGVGNRHPASLPWCGVHPGAPRTPRGRWLVLSTVLTQMMTPVSAPRPLPDVCRITYPLKSNWHANVSSRPCVCRDFKVV